MITSSNIKSKSKKRPLPSSQKNDLSNQLCEACQLPLRVYSCGNANANVNVNATNGGSIDESNVRVDVPTVNIDSSSDSNSNICSSEMTRQITDNYSSLTVNMNLDTAAIASLPLHDIINGSGTTTLLQSDKAKPNPPHPPIVNHNNSIKHRHQDAIITCSNMFGEVKCCKSSQISDASPHYHFACIEKIIQPKSKLYSDICQYIQEREDDSKRKRLKKTLAKANAKGGKLVCQPGTMPNKIAWAPHYTGNATSSTGSYSESLHSNTSSGRNTPTNKKLSMKNPFICSMCDMQGSAQYLAEYFYNFRSEKCGYYKDEEAVDPIRPASSFGDDDSLGMEREHGFVKYLMSRQEKDVLGMPYKPTEVSLHRIRNILQHTRGTQTKSAFDFSTLTATHLIGQPVRLFCNISNSYHTGRIIDARQISEMESSRLKTISKRKDIDTKNDTNVKPPTSAFDLPPGILLDKQIGQTQYLVRFRARADGRKVAVQQWLYLEEHPIMVGVNIVWAKLSGQIQDVIESVTISPENLAGKGTVCTLKNDLSVHLKVAETTLERRRKLKQAKSKFRPAQIFLRTALEMMHVDDINMDSVGHPHAHDASTVNAPHSKSKAANNENTNINASMALKGAKPNAVALFFGKRYHCIRVNVANKSDIPAAATSAAKTPFFATPSVNTNRKKRNVENEATMDAAQKEANHKAEVEKQMEHEISILGKTFDDLSVVDFHSPPPEFKEYLQVLKGYDDMLVHTTMCALLEEEEQRRILERHKR